MSGDEPDWLPRIPISKPLELDQLRDRSTGPVNHASEVVQPVLPNRSVLNHHVESPVSEELQPLVPDPDPASPKEPTLPHISSIEVEDETDGNFSGFGDLYIGECSVAERYNTVLHLGLNVLSTLLLNASNYCAQILASPLRSEVNDAHRKHDWLEIGVPSVRNLWRRRISARRRITWLLLLSSSALLHLTWNSVVFVALAGNNYKIAVVTRDYANDSLTWPVIDQYTPSIELLALQQKLRSNELEHLNNMECINRYGDLTVALGDVVVVVENITTAEGLSQTNNTQGFFKTNDTHSSLLWTDLSYSDNDWIYSDFWMCSSRFEMGLYDGAWCTAGHLLPDAESWTLAWGRNGGNNGIGTGLVNETTHAAVQSCFSADSQKWQGQCTVRFSLGIPVIVCILNGLKVTAIAFTWAHWVRGARKSPVPGLLDGHEHDDSLVTVGDAVASFLQTPDPHTNDCSLANRSDFESAEKIRKRKGSQKKSACKKRREDVWPPADGTASVKARYQRLIGPQRWYQVASRKRWLFTLTACVATLIFVIAELGQGVAARKQHVVPTDLTSLWNDGWGTVQPYATTPTGVVHNNLPLKLQFWAAVLIANFPQLLLSALYLLLNGLMSAMLAAYEWSGFINERKTLRLSSPHGIQRSSYFLTLPHRFAIPLQILSAALHWLISQSLFVVNVSGYNYTATNTTGSAFPYKSKPNRDSTMIGYSVIGIIISLIVGSALVTWVVYIGSFRLEGKAVEGEDGVESFVHMPLASTCSAAISAACHPPERDDAAFLLPVLWGWVPGTDVWTFTSAKEVRTDLPRQKSGGREDAAVGTS